jgi:hypothetical protein
LRGANKSANQAVTPSCNLFSRKYTAGGCDASAAEPGAKLRAGHR